MPGEAIVGTIAITLDRTAKVDRDQFIQTLCLSRRVPLKEHIFTRPMRHPQVTQACLSIAGIEISDGRLIDLDVGPAHHLIFDLPINRLQPLAGQLDPSSQALARQPDLMAILVNLFLPIKRLMIAIFTNDYLGQ
jgi:hypothetical protein